MKVEWFQKLREIASLTKMRVKHLDDIRGQEDRLSKLADTRLQADARTVRLKHESSELQDRLLLAEAHLKRTEEQARRLRDQGGDERKIQDYVEEAGRWEAEAFTILDLQEALNAELLDAKTFSAGLARTTQEISGEVERETAREREALASLELRLKLLEEELPDDFRSALKRTMAKNLALGPFTRVEAGACFFCKHKVSRTDESEIDMQQGLKHCAQCGRIFLPYGH